MPKNQNILKNSEIDKTPNSYESIDSKEITKKTIDSEDFRIKSNSKNENKIFTKSNHIQNNKLEQNNYYTSSTYNFQENKFTNNIFINKSIKGVYKKKTIGGSTNKSMSFFKKNSFNNSFNQNNYLFQLTNSNHVDNTYNNTILSNVNIKESDIEDNKNVCTIETMSDKNIDLYLQNNNTEVSGINLRYTTPEEYFGFKKVNKIEEMEVSFVPLNEKNINNNNDNYNDDDNDKYNENDHEINTEKEDEYNKEDKKEVIIEAIEEYNEFEGDNEKIIQKIKNEFNNYEEKLFYKTIDYFKTNFDNEINKENEKENNNKSMINIT
jgi:hypothetical protein